MTTTRVFVLAALLLALAPAPGAADPPAVALARKGGPAMKIVLAHSASPPVQEHAKTLADMLGRITSARFEIASGDGREGLAVGLPGDFPALGLAERFPSAGPADRERYLLRSHAAGLQVIGAGEIALGHAVWDLLHRLGCRQYFPGPAWEIVPRAGDLSLAVETLQKPDYLTRRIWFGYGTWDYNEGPYRDWCRRNRTESAFQLNTGHAYDGIIASHKAVFASHPEYLGLVDGRRTSTKLCVSNGAVRDLVVAHALEHFRQNPQSDSVSVDPSDGGGWCQCDACAAIGSPSDLALTLANAVSAALEEKLPGKYVALYAYNYHSPPPKIQARPRVIVSVATGFIKGGWTLDALIAGWRRQGVAQFGIREYYSVILWDHDLPGRPRGSNIDYLRRTLPKFARDGAQFMSAESSDNWGPCGLGYYLASRMLWDVREADRVDELRADFLDRCFGPARGPMDRFYRLLDGSQPPLWSEDLIGRMYRLIGEAGGLAGSDAGIRTRLDHLLLYTRYVDLYRRYSNASAQARQSAAEQMLRHVYRMRTTMMVHAKAIARAIDRDKAVRVPAAAGWNVPEPKNPWKSSQPWTRAELDAMLAEGVAAHRVTDIEPVRFSRDLVPAAPLKLPDLPALDDPQRDRGRRTFYTWADRAGTTLEVKITGGLIAHYRDRGNVKVFVRPADADARDDAEAVPHAQAPPDGQPRRVTLRLDRVGLHAIEVEDGSDMTEVAWPAGTPRTIELSAESTPRQAGRRSAYFYVPRGTKSVGGYAGGGGNVCDSDGKVAAALGKDEGYFRVDVPPGQDGKLWSFRGAAGTVILLTVPPYCARSPAELLLPKEVVAKDAPQSQPR